MSHHLPSLFLSIARATEAIAVSPMSLAVLAAVVEMPGKRPTDLTNAYLQDVPKADLSVFIRRLEDLNLVVKVSSPHDKRSILVFPTEHGRKALGDAVGVYQGLGIAMDPETPVEAPVVS